MKVVIVGGVAGGATAAARLRRLSEHAEIILFERGEHISFANCGLPYYIGGAIQDQRHLLLQTPNGFHQRFCVDVRTNAEVISINRQGKSVTVIQGGHEYAETYDKLILSPGAEPIVPPLPGIRLPGVFTVRNVPDSLRIRQHIERMRVKRAVVVGGGYIGVEMAENLRERGLDVSIIEMQHQLIAPLDQDMAAVAHHYARKKGIRLILGSALKSIEDRGESLLVRAGEHELEADAVILALGVRPESHLAKAAGLTVNPRGAICVDEQMLTSDPDIYAVGDAVEVRQFVSGQLLSIPLAGPANKQGRIAADNVMGLHRRYEGTQGSSVLKLFDMTIATTGLSERTAKELGLSYEKSFTLSTSHATYYPGATNMNIKLIFERESGKILGAQIMGFDGVDKRCDVIATAIRFGATVNDLTKLELCYAPPFGSAKDPVNMAGYVAENIRTGLVKTFHWHDVGHVKGDPEAVMLDVRTVREFESGHIQGAVNIPVDVLREHLQELSKDRTYYVNCRSGQRSYIACRILMQNGFECQNLSGGYQLYELATT